MISLTPDPANPERLLVTATVSMYLDRVLVESLNAEIESQIRAQAVADLKNNADVKKAIANASTRKLLEMLGVDSKPNPALDAENPTPKKRTRRLSALQGGTLVEARKIDAVEDTAEAAKNQRVPRPTETTAVRVSEKSVEKIPVTQILMPPEELKLNPQDPDFIEKLKKRKKLPRVIPSVGAAF